MPGKDINNPLGAFGYTDLTTQLGSSTKEFRASANVTAGRAVSITTTGSVAHSATDGTAALVVGIALNTASAGDVVNVVTDGIAENVACAGATSAGGILKRSVTTAGYVSVTATPAAGEAIGVAINDSTANTVDVWVVKSL